MKAAILGAGPAGLMAALAAERAGLTPVIFAKELSPSFIPSDMYLQRPLPDVPGVDPDNPDAAIEYIQRGSAIGYAQKCYGDQFAEVSWSQIRWGFGDAWWLSEIYSILWERFIGNIKVMELNSMRAAMIAREYSMTFSTLPAPSLCNGEHSFNSVATLLVRRRSVVWDQPFPYDMVYNGATGEGEEWFRCSRLRGWTTHEYAKQSDLVLVEPDAEVLIGQKFIGNTCTCNPAINRVGRWAQWKRGVLNHHAYEQTVGMLASAGFGQEGATA